MFCSRYLISAQTLEIRMKLGGSLRQECKYVGPGQQRLYGTVCVTKKENTNVAKLSSIFTLTFSNRPIQTPNCASVHQKFPYLLNGTVLFSVRYKIKFYTKFWIHLAFRGRKHNGQYKCHLIQIKTKLCILPTAYLWDSHSAQNKQ